MENDNEKFSLRDQIALTIFASLGAKTSYVSDSTYENTPMSENSVKFYDPKIENMITVSYHIADLFRKVRLRAFK